MASINVAYSDEGFIVVTITDDKGTQAAIPLTEDQAAGLCQLVTEGLVMVRVKRGPVPRIVLPPEMKRPKS